MRKMRECKKTINMNFSKIKSFVKGIFCDKKELTEEEKKSKFKSDLKFCAWFTVIFLIFRFFIYDWYIVPSCSMVPTLLVGDMPFVEKFAYGISKHNIWFSPDLFSGRYFFRNNVKRGEIIVFKHPYDPKHPEYNDLNLIKRVIALPGDKVSVHNGVICVNGVEAELVYKEEVNYFDYPTGSTYIIKRYEERLPLSDAPVHIVGYIDEMKYSDVNNFDEVTVPEGHYFVMGDNRDCSRDSRCGLGFIPAENLMGRAIFTVYSIDKGVKLWEFWRWFQNIRYERLLKRIN